MEWSFLIVVYFGVSAEHRIDKNTDLQKIDTFLSLNQFEAFLPKKNNDLFHSAGCRQPTPRNQYTNPQPGPVLNDALQNRLRACTVNC